MPRPKLKENQHTIATCSKRDLGKTPKKRGHTWTCEWRICLNGVTERHVTTVTDATEADLVAKAEKTAADLIEHKEERKGTSAWKTTQRMGDFVTSVSMTSVDRVRSKQYGEPLRPKTKARYKYLLGLYAEVCGDAKIRDAAEVDAVITAMQRIAEEHRRSTAEQAVKVVSRYVFRRLVKLKLLKYNPMSDLELNDYELPEDPAEPYKGRRQLEARGRALTQDEHRRTVDYLLARDPATEPAKRRASAVKAQTAIDMTLLQASTGLRISEARHLRRKDVEEGPDGRLTLEVLDTESKTHKGRKIKVYDPRVAQRIRERLDKLPQSPLTPIFGKPTDPSAVWDRSNAQKAVRRVYDDTADALGIPMLRQVSSHVWRATLNSHWADLGVSAERRAAYFGHSPEMNKTRYTDLTDLSALDSLVGGDSAL